jgi:hypothetical protein
MVAVIAIHWMKDLANSPRLKSVTPFDPTFVWTIARRRFLLGRGRYNFILNEWWQLVFLTL